MWDWWDDTVDAVSDWVDDAWDTATDYADEVVETVSDWVGDAWDTVDDYVSGAADTVTGWVDDGIEWVNEVVDTYIWDTTEDEAVVESWVRDTFDIPDREGVGFMAEVGAEIVDSWDESVDTAKKTTEQVTQTVSTFVTDTADKAGDIINNISIALGVGFDAAMAAIGLLPTLLTEWRADLAKFFTFDMDEFMTAMQTMSESMKSKE